MVFTDSMVKNYDSPPAALAVRVHGAILPGDVGAGEDAGREADLETRHLVVARCVVRVGEFGHERVVRADAVGVEPAVVGEVTDAPGDVDDVARLVRRRHVDPPAVARLVEVRLLGVRLQPARPDVREALARLGPRAAA